MAVVLDAETMQEFRLVGTVDIVSDDEDESTVIVNS